eukprot:scaffold379_cov235-Pinguiococcus_pyrenoidosus.AAC.11
MPSSVYKASSACRITLSCSAFASSAFQDPLPSAAGVQASKPRPDVPCSLRSSSMARAWASLFCCAQKPTPTRMLTSS